MQIYFKKMQKYGDFYSPWMTLCKTTKMQNNQNAKQYGGF
jgi:hypothetical protein